MNTIELTNENIEEVAAQAAEIIKNGGLVIAPFDTVYGIIADPRNDDALLGIFKFKKRPITQTLGIAVSSVEMIEKLTNMDQNGLDFIKEKTPGAYTFITKDNNDNDIDDFCKFNDTIGIRIPDNKLVLSIAEKCGGIIAQTSANKSEKPNCYSIDDLIGQFDIDEISNIDLIIDGGEIKHNRASTIINMTKTPPEIIKR